MIEPGLAHGGDDDPVAGEIDGVAVALVHGGHAATAEGDFQRIAGPLPLHGNDILLPVRAEATEHGIHLLAVHHDMGFAGKRVAVRRLRGPGVA